MKNPYGVVIEFEEAIADYCGSKYAVAVESCTSALFLSLMYRKKKYRQFGLGDLGTIMIPARTYPGVPCSIIHAGGKVGFYASKWEGQYELGDTGIFDAALTFRPRMYRDTMPDSRDVSTFQCISFHIKKNLPIGRGGAILTDDLEAVEWFRRARFDGRNPVPLLEDNFTMLGWNCYMTPDQAARGLQLLQALGDRQLLDLEVSKQGYPDLSKFKIYTQ